MTTTKTRKSKTPQLALHDEPCGRCGRNLVPTDPSGIQERPCTDCQRITNDNLDAAISCAGECVVNQTYPDNFPAVLTASRHGLLIPGMELFVIAGLLDVIDDLVKRQS